MIRKFIFLFILIICAAPAWGATYHFSQGGNDTTGDGSYTSPWKTVAKFNTLSLNAGDDAYFLCGGTWNLRTEWTRMLVEHSGVDANNYAVIGAYHLDDAGSPVYAVKGAKPIFLMADATVVSGEYWGIVEAANRSYLQIENLDLRDTLGNAIWISGGNYIRVYNCVSTNTGGSGMTVTSSQNVHYSGNDVSRYRENTATSSGAGLGVTQSDHVVIEYNTVHKAPAGTGGEGIYAFFNCDDVEIRYNKVFDIVRIGIYVGINITNCKIHHNLVYGTTDLAWQNYYDCSPTCTRFPGLGIGLEDEYAYRAVGDCGETRCPSSNIDIYNNLIAYVWSGFWICMPETFDSGWVYDGVRIYNNTVIAALYAIYDPTTTASRYTNSYIRNNIFSCMGESNCTMYSGPASPGWTADYNLWPAAVSAPLSGAHDVIDADPELTKAGGWRTLTANSMRGTEFAPASASSPVVDVGVDLGDTYENAFKSEGTDFIAGTFATHDQDAQGAAWDFGAFAWPGAGEPEPPAGTGIPGTPTASWNLNADYADDIGSLDWTGSGTIAATNGHLGGTNTAYQISAGGKLSIADAAAIEPSTAFAFSGWAKMNFSPTDGHDYTILSKPSQYTLSLHYYSPNYTLKWRIYANPSGDRQRVLTSTTNMLPSGEWHHVVAGYDPSTGNAFLYLDGTAVGVNSNWGSTTLTTGSGALTIASDGVLDDSAMSVDDVVFYGTTLPTSGDVTTLYGLVEDFAEEADDPVPNIYVNSFGSGGFIVTPEEDGGTATVDVTWTLSGGTPSECGIAVDGETYSNVTCGDGIATITLPAAGLYSAITFRTKAEGGEYVTSVLPDSIRLKASATPNEWIVAASSGDFTSTPDDWGTATGIRSGDTIRWTGSVNLDISGGDALGLSTLNITGDGHGTLTGSVVVGLYAVDFVPDGIPTMGSNVGWLSRALPIMTWPGPTVDGNIPDNAVFFGNGTGINIDLDGIYISEGEHCYVRPKLPHGTLTFDAGADLGPCSTTCTDRRICIHPDYQKRFFHSITKP